MYLFNSYAVEFISADFSDFYIYLMCVLQPSSTNQEVQIPEMDLLGLCDAKRSLQQIDG